MTNFSAPVFTATGRCLFVSIQTILLTFEASMTARAATTHYTPADVFLATGIPTPKQNQWYERQTIKPSRLDKKPTGSGCYRMVCPATVYQIGITAEGTQIGLPARQAAEAARLFADDQPGRPANTLFENGRTMLVLGASGSRIVNSHFDDSVVDVCGRPFEASAIIDIGQIVSAIDSILTNISERQP
jgi:hypothetical protein